jgi:hypothetical protein
MVLKAAGAIAAILATCWLVYQATQCVFFFAAVKRGENQLVFAGSCPFLRDPQHVKAVQKAFRPSVPELQLDTAGRVQAASSAPHTFSTSGKRNRSALQNARIEDVQHKIEAQQEFDIAVGFGITVAGQTRMVKVLATSDSLKQQLMNSTSWTAIFRD